MNPTHSELKGKEKKKTKKQIFWETVGKAKIEAWKSYLLNQ